jgi:hypothetical protein
MLKVIKSNALFALVLLLSIPAYASQPVDASKAASFAARVASGFRGFKSTLASTYQKLPSAQELKAAGSATLAMAKRGANTVGQQTTEFGQKAWQSTLPAAQASLAFAGKHSTEIKIASGALAALGVTFAGLRAVKAVLTRGKKPVKHTPLRATKAPEFKAPTLLLQEAKYAAEADIQTLKTIHAAGKSLALRMKSTVTANVVTRVSNATAQFNALKGSFRYTMSNCEVPEQAKELKEQFVVLCQEAYNVFENPSDCLNKEACDALFERLTALTEQFDGLISESF